MAIFEYKCIRCGKISEFLEISQDSVKAKKSCSHCGSSRLEKQLSVFAPGIKQGDSKRCQGRSDQSCPHLGR